MPCWVPRLLGWGLLIAFLVFAGVSLTVRYWVFPNIDAFRPDIVGLLTKQIGRPVSLGAIETGWDNLRPSLRFNNVAIADDEGTPALTLERVDTVVSWRSLLAGSPRFARVEIQAPSLLIRRDPGGRVFVAGVPVKNDQPDSDEGFADWLLAQGQIIVRDADVRWDDDQRHAPTLALRHVNFNLLNGGSRHRFSITAEPPAGYARLLDVRGDFRGRDPDALESWKGRLYTHFDDVDLAVWRTWIDYPARLPRGRGGVEAWLDFAAREPLSVTATVALNEVEVQLRRDLPTVELDRLSGRLTARRDGPRYLVDAHGLTVAGRDGLAFGPLDFSGAWEPLAEAGGRGEVTATVLDLDPITRLAEALPLDAATRRLLVAYDPRGKVRDLKLTWQGDRERVATFALRGHFEALGLKAQGILPGLENITGRVEATEKGGTFSLDSSNAAVDLPRVFADPHLRFDNLTAQTDWTVSKGKVDVRFKKVAFSGADATGTVSGSYVASAGAPHAIDLTGKVTRADGAKAWRYMPLIAGDDVREWLRYAVSGARVSDVSLRLRGDPMNFPYPDGNGEFKVAGKIQDGRLRYADRWPAIEGINGELLFDGPRMVVKASSGKIFGATVSDTTAEIPDLSAARTTVLIKGEASGATSEFVRFTRESPVGDWIARFTDPVVAKGDGNLTLALTLPLWDMNKTTVEGEYQFNGNDVNLDAESPTLSGVMGRLAFTEKGIHIRQITGSTLGAPFSLSAATRDDGSLGIQAQGGFTAPALRKAFVVPLVDRLSGSSTWRASIDVRPRGTEIVVESPLTGISTDLPEPLNKNAGSSLPLRIERQYRREGNVMREFGAATLGNGVRARFVRRLEADHAVWEKAAISNTELPALPSEGLAVSATLPRADVDGWRDAVSASLNNASSQAPQTGSKLAAMPVAVLVRSAEAKVLGRRLHEATLAIFLRNGETDARVTSKEVNGQFHLTQGEGAKLTARLAHLAIPDPDELQRAEQFAAQRVETLPAVELVAERFNLRGRDMGKLELKARNANGTWLLDSLSVSSPDGGLTGHGQWNARANRTDLRFNLEVLDVGQYLGRLGYADAVRRGTASLSGNLSWNDAPMHIDYPSLAGAMKLEAAGGQFRKLEPGIGKLLGVLSLQSLPRRITLDFRDVFSEGFAFDAITGSMNVTHGRLTTKDLEIRGPSAKVLMSGDVDLEHETQQLKVRVQPALGESVAVGAMIIATNPLLGAGAWIAQKILRDPLDQIFAFEYAVTGGWDDPKVERARGAAQPQPDKAP